MVVACCVLHVACRMSHVACSALHVACCMLSLARLHGGCMLQVACHMSHVVCCMLHADMSTCRQVVCCMLHVGMSSSGRILGASGECIGCAPFRGWPTQNGLPMRGFKYEGSKYAEGTSRLTGRSTRPFFGCFGGLAIAC